MLIKLAVFDFDGTLTDGTVYFGSSEDAIMKQYNVKDGMGIHILKNEGVKVGVISGFKDNKSTREICKHLKVDYISIGSNNKVDVIQSWINGLGISMDEVAFMGDDINDLELLNCARISGCPSDANEECLKVCRFISKYRGGHGAVREFCNFILEYQVRPITGLICVKYTSKRCPLKNIRQFGNSTLLEMKIHKLLSLKFLDNVIVNTESDVIINFITERITDPRLKIVKRDVRYTADDISNREFCNAVMESVHDYVLYSPVTMPFISEDTYNKMYMWSKDTKFDSVILVADGKQGSGHDEEQHSYCFGASIMKKSDVILFGDFIGNRPYFQQCNSKERIDIDTPEEFEIALYHYYNSDAIYGCENQNSLELNALYSFRNSKI